MWQKTHKNVSNQVSIFKKISSPEGPGRGLTCLDSIKTRGYTGKKLTLFFYKNENLSRAPAGVRNVCFGLTRYGGGGKDFTLDIFC